MLWWGSPIVDVCWNNVHASRLLAGLGDNHETAEFPGRMHMTININTARQNKVFILCFLLE